MLFRDLAIFLKKGIWFLVLGLGRAARRFWFQGRQRSRRRGAYSVSNFLKGNVVSGDLAISKMWVVKGFGENVFVGIRGCLEGNCKKTLYGLTGSGFLNVVSELRGCLEADCKKTLYGLTASGF